MQRERVTESIIVFTSQQYARVTAGVVLTSAGAVLIDTMIFPKETLKIRHYVEERLGHPIRYVINTHYHADHTIGTCFFGNARVVAHSLCHKLLDSRGRESLEAARESSPEMQDVKLVLPNVTFDGEYTFHFGQKTFHLWHSPGHSPDSIVCFIEEDQVLFAADTLMTIPHFFDGDIDELRQSLTALHPQSFDVIVQGHGELILRGEIKKRIQKDLDYLDILEDKVNRAYASGEFDHSIKAITVESCGKSRVLLSGAAEHLHLQNIEWLTRYRYRRAEPDKQM